MTRWWLAALAAASMCGGARAEQMVTQILPAGFRSAEELAGILRPLVPPPGSVSGFHGQLVIKTTPQNLEELKRVLAALDTAPVNLLVSVRRTVDAEVSRDLSEGAARVRAGDVNLAAGRLAPGRGASATVHGADAAAGVRIEHQTRSREGNDVQTLRVLEGKEAFIHTGESVPVGERSVVVTGAGVTVAEGVRYEEFGTGFYVRPRLNGDTVILDIIPSRRERRGGDSASVQHASTTVSGLVGRWMEIGGVDSQSTRSSAGVASSRTITTRRADAIYVKVERLD